MPESTPAVSPKELFHVVERNPTHSAWGIYSRRRRSGRQNLFRLLTFTLDYDRAVDQACKLQAAATEPRDYSVQGARDAHDLPDRYEA